MSVRRELNEYSDLEAGIRRRFPQYIHDPIVKMHLELIRTHQERLIELIQASEDKRDENG